MRAATLRGNGSCRTATSPYVFAALLHFGITELTEPFLVEREAPRRDYSFHPFDTDLGPLQTLSFDFFKQRRGLPDESPHVPPVFQCCLAVATVLQRVLVPRRRSRSWRSAVHAAAPLARHDRCPARFSRPRLGAAARARKHRARIPGMSAAHDFRLTLAGWSASAADLALSNGTLGE